MDFRINTFIVGAQKSGTTSLAILLSQHPDVALASGKETHLFDEENVQQSGVPADLKERFFPNWKQEEIILDATPSYMYLPGCIEAIHRHNPNAKIIVILRKPGDRAYSQYLHSQRHGKARAPFLLWLMIEPFLLVFERNPLAQESHHRWHSFRDRGKYAKQIRRIRRFFPEILILDFDKIAQDQADVVRKTLAFLDLPLHNLIELNQIQVNKSTNFRNPNFLAHVVIFLMNKLMSRSIPS